LRETAQEIRMKRILIIGALALATAAPALAADLPPPMAPPPRAPAAYIPAPPPFSWTGFYVGLNAGYGFGSSTWSTPAGSVGSFSMNGALAGGTIGGNYQIGQFVIGAEGDIDWQNLRGASGAGICAPAAIGGCATASDWLATLRARAGFAADRALFYITGGGAFTDIKPSTGALSYGGGTEAGWTAGAGVEYAMTDNWTAKVEYLYADFEKATCNTSSCSVGNLFVPGVAPASVSFHENIVRAGVNYKF
jgi:outer membrane immunogenic protein